MRGAHSPVVGLLSVALPCALAAQFARGTGFTTTTTIDSGAVKHVSSTQMEMLGAKFRMAMKSDAVAATPFEFFQIWDSTAATVTQVMPSGSVAMVMPLSVISSSAMMKPPMSIETEPGVKSEIVDLGAGEKILGYATRHYHQTIAYTVKYTIGGETCSNRRNEVAEIWTTNEVKLPDLSAVLGRMSGGAGVGLAAPAVSQLDSLTKKGIPGTRLRTILMATSVGAAGDTLRVTSKTEITAINPDSVDARDFDVPAGYNVMDMSKTMADMNTGSMQETMFAQQLTMQDHLRKALCGR